jgi:hypothetical protein
MWLGFDGDLRDSRVRCLGLGRDQAHDGYDTRLTHEARIDMDSRSKRQRGATLIIAVYIAAAVLMAVGSLYFAWRSREFCKFLTGAFFVSSGILVYLYLADVSVPLLGTGFVETPQISGGRSIVHFILFLVCFYFGFIRKPKG